MEKVVYFGVCAESEKLKCKKANPLENIRKHMVLVARRSPATPLIKIFRLQFALLVCAVHMFFITGLFSFASATSIESIDTEQLVDRAELIFEGEAIASQTRQLKPGLIVTEITFDVQEVLAGEYVKPNLKLRFVGGSVSDNSMQIADMIYPRVGEQGVYFVESTTTLLVNPLVGWAQGHYVYERDAQSVQRLCTAKRDPITAIDFGSIPTDLKKPGTADAFRDAVRAFKEGQDSSVLSAGGVQISEGYARGVNLASSVSEAQNALTRAQFKAQLSLFIEERQSQRNENKKKQGSKIKTNIETATTGDQG